MKKRILSCFVLAVIMFYLTISAAYAGDCGCDENGPQYQNKAEVQPNKEL